MPGAERFTLMLVCALAISGPAIAEASGARQLAVPPPPLESRDGSEPADGGQLAVPPPPSESQAAAEREDSGQLAIPPLPPEVPDVVQPPSDVTENPDAGAAGIETETAAVDPFENSTPPEPKNYRVLLWIKPLPTAFFAALTTRPGFDALALPVGASMLITQQLELVTEVFLLEGVESCNLSPVVCRPFGFLSVAVGLMVSSQGAEGFFVLPKVIWSRYHEGGRNVVSQSWESGLEGGYRMTWGRLFATFSLGASVGWGSNVAESGSEYAIWSTSLRDARTRRSGITLNVDLNLLRVGTSF